MIIIMITCSVFDRTGKDSDLGFHVDLTGTNPNSSSSTTGIENVFSSYCPDGMSLVTDGPDGDFCMHSFELEIVSGNVGDHDQYAKGAIAPSDVVISSKAGRLPTSGVSFEQWQEILRQLGMHMITLNEWKAAAHGLKYPYGNTYDAAACATNQSTYDSSNSIPDETTGRPRALTGVFPECVSPDAVYDLTGSQWQWVDPQQTLSIRNSIKAMVKQGIEVWTGDQDEVKMNDVAFAKLNLNIQSVGLDPSSARLDADSTYRIDVLPNTRDWSAGNPAGYLIYDTSADGESNPLNVIMVELVPDQQPSSTNAFPAHLRVMWEQDGTPRTVKVGGASYTDPDTLWNYYWGHLPFFNGDITTNGVIEPLRE